MANLFRLILLCIPLLGAVGAMAEVQRLDREEAEQGAAPAEPEMVLALSAAAVPPATSEQLEVATAEVLAPVQQAVAPDLNRAAAGLPMCLALVLLVALIRLRAS